MQDVPEFLRRKNVTLTCYMDPTRRAVIDKVHAVRLNYETFVFSNTAAKEMFRANEVAYCGLLTDPVTKCRFRPSADSPRHLHEKVEYFFQTWETYEAFVVAPEEYRLPGAVM